MKNISEEQKQKIKNLTGFTLDEIVGFTEGQFTRHIWRLYFNYTLTQDQYYWLRGYRELTRGGEKSTQGVLGIHLDDVLSVFGGQEVS